MKLDALAGVVSGAAASVIIVPCVTVCVHVEPQLIAPPVMLPLPAPDFATVSVNVGVQRERRGDDAAAVIVTVHAPVPVHAPLQPVNVEPAAGVAVSVTTVPSL